MRSSLGIKQSFHVVWGFVLLGNPLLLLQKFLLDIVRWKLFIPIDCILMVLYVKTDPFLWFYNLLAYLVSYIILYNIPYLSLDFSGMYYNSLFICNFINFH